MKINKSPLAPLNFPTLPHIEGVSLYSGRAGIKYRDRDDVLLVGLTPKSKVAGVFTQSSTLGAPVVWSQRTLKRAKNRRPIGILVNTGNANVFTGPSGLKTVKATTKAAASRLKTSGGNIFAASTGVIGEPLDPKPIVKALKGGDMRTCDWEHAADTIRTTDTFAKGAGRTVMIGDTAVKIAGIVKGSGMIAPNMATMLGFIFTDAQIQKRLLQKWLREICATTFNAITVDSDSSTSDMVLLAATQTADMDILKSDKDERATPLKSALYEVILELAHWVVKDGEGARKFISVQVEGAANTQEAKAVAMSIANSPLVKTAIAGEDANLVRIIMAIGKSGAKIERDRLIIRFGPYFVAQNGARASNYDENILSQYMQSDHIDINVNLGLGAGEFCAWTCDLTDDYIKINADYRS